MVMLTALPVTAILGVSLRILVAVCKTAVPDFSHLEGISDENNQLVSTAQKSFASAKLALFSQFVALDCAVLSAAIGVYLESKRVPRGKILLSRRAEIAMYIGYFVALQAMIQFLQNFDVLGEIVFGGSAHRVSFWALKLFTACLAGMLLGEFLHFTARPGEQDAMHILGLLQSVQQLAESLPVDDPKEIAEVPAHAQEEVGPEAI